MPTVILLDVSLSMSRPVIISDSSESHTRYSLACAGINSFLDYLSVHSKLEHVALVAFSSLYEVIHSFTRDYSTIRASLRMLKKFDKTCINTALHGVNQLVLNEWGYQSHVQILLVTDGNAGGTTSRASCFTPTQLLTGATQAPPFPPPYPARLHVICVSPPNDASLVHSMPFYQKLVELASAGGPSTTNGGLVGGHRGGVYCPEQQLSLASVCTVFSRACEQHYAELTPRLRCGQLESRVRLVPAPPPQPTYLADFEAIRLQVQPVIDVFGFLTVQELGSPIVISKHLILPCPPAANSGSNSKDHGKGVKIDMNNATDVNGNDDEMDPGKVPNFCVLLHGALKVENMAALVTLNDNWYGYITWWGDAARGRRSCLVLCALAPGGDAAPAPPLPSPAPWLGPMDQLGPGDDNDGDERGAGPDAGAAFPIRSAERRSYAGGAGGASGGGGGAGGIAAAAWARPHALHADVQKVLRHARKLPEKTQHFYKELNRIRRSAIAVGFVELLSCMADMFDRECTALPGAASPDCAMQLTHAAQRLREPRCLNATQTIAPLATKFNLLQ